MTIPRPVNTVTSQISKLDKRAPEVVTERPAREEAYRFFGGLALVMALTAVLRLVALGTAYDIFGDEINYVDLGTSLHHGQFPPVFPNSGPFLLHPPFFFALSAAWQILLRPDPLYWFNLLNTARQLNALLAVVSAGCMYVLGTRLATRRAGIVAGLLFALDPYLLRENGRVYLEDCTMMLVLLGYLVLLQLFQHRARRPWLVAVSGGFLLGLSVVTKDMAALLVVLPLAAALVCKWGVDRRLTAIAFVSSLVPYAIYVTALAAVGSLGAFWEQESSGLRRALGLVKTTGFTRAGSPSLVHTVLGQLAGFWTTYAVLGLGVLAMVYLAAVSPRPDHRLWVAVTASGAFTIIYSLFFGTIEENFLYFLMVPAILSLAVGVTVLAQHVTWPSIRRQLGRAVVAALALVLAYNVGLWVHTRTTRDNGMETLTNWFLHNEPNPGLVGNDSNVTAYILQRNGFAATVITSPQEAARLGVKYMTLLPVEAQGNYVGLTPAKERFIMHHGERVFSFSEPSFGKIEVFRTNNPAVW